ncbi:hypothetical protein OROMI_017184 [Orobanche minor]
MVMSWTLYPEGVGGGIVSNSAMHALFLNEVVRPNAHADEFWFRIGHQMIRLSRNDYALHVRVDSGKHIAEWWLWMLVEDQTRWESFPWGLYSYQILVTYLSDISTDPAGVDLSYHFYVTYTLLYMGFLGYTLDRIQMWDHAGNFVHPATSLYTLEVEDAWSCCFYHILRRGAGAIYAQDGPMQEGGMGRGKGRVRDVVYSVGDVAGERIFQQQIFGPVISEPIYLTTGQLRALLPTETRVGILVTPLENVNVSAASGASASWFLMLHDGSILIDVEGFYSLIPELLVCDGSMIGLPKMFWFIPASRRGGSLRIDEEDLDFLISHVYGLRPF